MTMWWLSFCDPDAPTGEQFLGACIVDAVDEITAVRVAHILGINPGGEVAFQDLDLTKVAMLSFNLLAYRDRFIPRRAAIDLSEIINREMGS